MAWKRRHGGGRVLCSTLGPFVSELDMPEMRAILGRGLLWAAGAEPAEGS